MSWLQLLLIYHYYAVNSILSIEFFHNSRLIRRIQQNKIYKKSIDLTRDWTWIPRLTVRHLNHYTTMFSVLVWGYDWILFMHSVIRSNSSNSFKWMKISSFWKNSNVIPRRAVMIRDNTEYTECTVSIVQFHNRVFHSLYKVGRNGNFVFKGFNNNNKKVTSSWARPDATDY